MDSEIDLYKLFKFLTNQVCCTSISILFYASIICSKSDADFHMLFIRS